MSVTTHIEPQCTANASAIELHIESRPRPLVEGFPIRRLLPAAARRTVGPFCFFDHMGPVAMPPGEGLDVPPHPHIGLATVTYLFDGEILHRDSLGSEQRIAPGAVNWMTAGRGIVHSERSPAASRASGARAHGLQLWVALPHEHEEIEPSFAHHDARDIPQLEQAGARLRVVAGTAYGSTSPVAVLSPLFYVDARIDAGAMLHVTDEHVERAAYVVEGRIACGDATFEAGTMLVLRAGATVELRAPQAATVMLMGGAPLDGPRHIVWNFVSSSRQRIDDARLAWHEDRFPRVPGDADERVPLPVHLRP